MIARRLTNAKNKLSYWMLKRKMSTDAMRDSLTDSNATGLWLMEQGAVLPTKRDLRSIADVLQVRPTDIWDADELDLLGTAHEGNGSGHGDQVRFRVWMRPEDKAKLEQSIKILGFKTPTDWFRLQAEITLKKAAQKAMKRGF